MFEEYPPLQVTDAEKLDIVKALLWFKESTDFHNRFAELKLANFVGPDSHHFFSMVKISKEFIKDPVETWKDNAEYNHATIIVKSLKVVNDASERGVKLGQTFYPRRKLKNDIKTYYQLLNTPGR